MRRIVGISLVCSLLVALSACNTVAGAGKDVERTGEKIQDASKK